MIGGGGDTVSAEGKLRKSSNRFSRNHSLPGNSKNAHGQLNSPEVKISSDFVYPFYKMFIFQNFELKKGEESLGVNFNLEYMCISLC